MERTEKTVKTWVQENFARLQTMSAIERGEFVLTTCALDDPGSVEADEIFEWVDEEYERLDIEDQERPVVTSAAEMETALLDALRWVEGMDLAEVDGPDTIYPVVAEFESMATFEQAGVLTSDKGLVIRLTNGQEYQLTIVRSK